MRALLLAVAALAGCGHHDSREEIAGKLADIQPGVERSLGDGTSVTMARIGATDPVSGGWQRATSTGGGFTVELPLAFNDFVIRADTTDHVETRTYAVGAKSLGLLAWTATCIARREGQPPPAAAASDDVVPLGSPPTAYERTIALADRLCILIVEAQGSDPLPSAADRARFFGSFAKTGPINF